VSRLFIAAMLPDHVRDELAARLPRPAEAGVRWVPVEQWHVTLRFLGEGDEGAAADALTRFRLPRATARLGPRVSRLGHNVVCLPVSGLDDLAASVRDLTEGIGDPPERSFVGHLTLARLRDRSACGLTGTAVDLSFGVDEVVLVRSTPGPGGARHQPLLSVPLS
jgi:2'-5' RNA ligase